MCFTESSECDASQYSNKLALKLSNYPTGYKVCSWDITEYRNKAMKLLYLLWLFTAERLSISLDCLILYIFNFYVYLIVQFIFKHISY